MVKLFRLLASLLYKGKPEIVLDTPSQIKKKD